MLMRPYSVDLSTKAFLQTNTSCADEHLLRAQALCCSSQLPSSLRSTLFMTALMRFTNDTTSTANSIPDLLRRMVNRAWK
jgi:hypothetical protein